MVNIPFIFLIAILLAFFFAFWNGFTDAAYSISTAVAETIGKGIVEPGVIDGKFILAVLVGGLICRGGFSRWGQKGINSDGHLSLNCFCDCFLDGGNYGENL